MKKQLLVLTTILMLGNSTNILATTDDLILDAIYAADKADELACFADDKYINLLEQKNAELLSQKYNYKGVFTKTPYFASAFFASLGAMGIGGISLLKSAILHTVSNVFKDNVLENNVIKSILEDKNILENISINNINKEEFAQNLKLELHKIYSTLSSNTRTESIVHFVIGGVLLGAGIKAFFYITNCNKKIHHDRIIDLAIQENQDIIEKLKEIKGY